MPKSLVPKKLRQYLKNALGIQFLLDENEKLKNRLTLLENKFYQSKQELEKDAKQRWKNSSPDSNLTWSTEIPGDNFINLADTHGLFGTEKSILEIGPGYGRLLKAMEKAGVEFASYLGIDISSSQVDYLTENFGKKNVEFMLADVETFTTEQRFDTLISSLTFKHLFPSCEKAMGNIGRVMKPGGMVCIDFIEGNRRLFEEDGMTYIRHYSREELAEIMTKTGFEIVTYDTVEHMQDLQRLVVVARKTWDANSGSHESKRMSN